MKFAWFHASLCLALAACESISYLPGSEPESLVIREFSPFYLYGPQQPGGPDRNLELGDRVRTIRREFGFSRVQLTTGESGYMANEDLEPAPPAAVPRPWPVVTATPRPAPASTTSSSPQSAPPSTPTYSAPPVEVPLPEPDLNDLNGLGLDS